MEFFFDVWYLATYACKACPVVVCSYLFIVEMWRTLENKNNILHLDVWRAIRN